MNSAFEILIQELKALGAKKVNIEIDFGNGDNGDNGEISPEVTTSNGTPNEPNKPKIEIPKEMLEEEF